MLVPVIAWVVLAMGVSSGSASAQNPETESTSGLIVASDVYLSAKTFDSAAALADAMNRLHQPQAINQCCNGVWRIHFAVLLERPSEKATLNLEFYRVAAVNPPAPRSRVFSSAISVRSGETTVFINDFVVSTDLGFAAGHQYEVTLWTATDTGRTALAKGGFMLK